MGIKDLRHTLKRKGDAAYSALLAFRVTKRTFDELDHYSKPPYNFEIYEPIRDFIRDKFLPSLKEAAIQEDELARPKAEDDETTIILP